MVNPKFLKIPIFDVPLRLKKVVETSFLNISSLPPNRGLGGTSSNWNLTDYSNKNRVLQISCRRLPQLKNKDLSRETTCDSPRIYF